MPVCKGGSNTEMWMREVMEWANESERERERERGGGGVGEKWAVRKNNNEAREHYCDKNGMFN